MKKRILLAAVLAMALTLLCACAQRVQEMDESGYEVYFLSDPASAGGEDAICAQRTRLALDDTMETEDCVRALMGRCSRGLRTSRSDPPSRMGQRSSRSRYPATGHRST